MKVFWGIKDSWDEIHNLTLINYLDTFTDDLKM